ASPAQLGKPTAVRTVPAGHPHAAAERQRRIRRKLRPRERGYCDEGNHEEHGSDGATHEDSSFGCERTPRESERTPRARQRHPRCNRRARPTSVPPLNDVRRARSQRLTTLAL